MSKKNPYQVVTSMASAMDATKQAQNSDNISHTKRYDRALAHAPASDTNGPSLQQAKKYAVDSRNYTTKERAAAEMAMDFNGAALDALSFTEATGFPGFPTLALLAQLPEYRSMHETLADEVVRCWGKVISAGDTPATQLQDIEAELERIELCAIIRKLVVHDQSFGGGHVYIKLRNDEDVRTLPLLLKPYSVKKNSFEGLRVVEPYWVTPNFYNSIDPTAADFYKPSTWWMLAVEVHATRMHTIISRPVPDMLKPTYSFRGVSMSQLAMPYVDNWLRTRQSVSDTVKQFSISGVKVDLQQALLPGAGQDLAIRAELINAYRDNRNILFLDNATEDFFQVNTPLSGLDALQAQAQEQMSAVSHIPLVKLLGVTPTGLNASSEGEIRVFYDYVRGYQRNVLSDLMSDVLKIVQLSLFGVIDPHVIWEWSPLMELTSLEQAEVRAKDADTDSKYIEAGVISPEQIAETLNADAHSRYSGILDMCGALDQIPDDNIDSITQELLNINPPVSITSKIASSNKPTEGHSSQILGTGGGNSDPSITDPDAGNDPGLMPDYTDEYDDL